MCYRGMYGIFQMNFSSWHQMLPNRKTHIPINWCMKWWAIFHRWQYFMCWRYFSLHFCSSYSLWRNEGVDSCCWPMTPWQKRAQHDTIPDSTSFVVAKLCFNCNHFFHFCSTQTLSQQSSVRAFQMHYKLIPFCELQDAKPITLSYFCSSKT